MDFEENNAMRGHQWLSQLTAQNGNRKFGLLGTVKAPEIVKANSFVLVMKQVIGYNLAEAPLSRMSSEVKESIASDMILVHFHGLLIGPVAHCDLHPGNIMLQPDHKSVTLVDWNPLMSVPQGDRQALHALILQLHRNSGLAPFELYAALGVQPRKDVHIVRTDMLGMGKLYNLPSTISGAFNLTDCLSEFQKFHFPEWMLLWQKATMALSNTLVHLSASSNLVSSRIDALLNGPLCLS